ncbi:MAG: molybdopterin-dependent oxidoreductase [Parvimonas sp.]|uniref:molybdopterin-containing oxidoreductase family protein n=1 Tax=Parvimonas sp. TaxID=1944660 RepID=UPI0025CC6A4A|nr:molybdopterin-dependent oxidoreductase [Parvimonas sp.]MCI5997117.1 molybdopterin-dependent oxidoreductase [Parvimonas sp.]MDY3050091.1 molybdopterin-dependent oxidoreductase [Parvimonas sp.]
MEKKECICGICPGDCQVEVQIENNRILKIYPSSVKKPSALCLRGLYSDEIVNSKDRIKSPLIRVGKKGEGKFKEVSWSDAISYIGENFNKIVSKYGPQALMSHFGRGAFEYSTDDYVNVKSPGFTAGGFFSPIGSPNNASVASLCYVSYGVFAPVTTMGFPITWLEGDIENTDLIVVWGTNPKTDSPPFRYQSILKAKRRGCKVVVVDHYKSDIAKIADLFVQIKSGMDGYFILTLINYLHRNNLLDNDFLDNYTFGKYEFLNYIKDFTVEKCEKITGINRKILIDFAREISHKPSVLMTYTGLEYSNSAVQTIRALLSLWALLGNLDVRGGMYINPKKSNDRVKKLNMENNFVSAIGEKEFPLFSKLINQAHFMMFPKAVLEEKPYKIRGLLNIGSAITNNYPNSKLFEKALNNLDFFVNVDRFLTKDALYADVVLPATTYYEDESFVIYKDRIELRHRVLQPVGESKPNIFIMQMIAESMGFGNNFPKNEKEILEFSFYNKPEILKSLKENSVYYFPKNTEEKKYKKYKFGLLRDDKKTGFPTPSGKFELYSNVLKSYGYEPLPKFEFAKEGEYKTKEIFKDYPLILNTGARIKSTFRTQHLNIIGLLKHQPKPFVIMNKNDAKNRNIIDGDLVEIITVRGSVEIYAKVTDDIKEGDLEVNVGGGSPYQNEFWKNSNVNDVTDNKNIDKISGFPCFKNLLCEVRKK